MNLTPIFTVAFGVGLLVASASSVSGQTQPQDPAQLVQDGRKLSQAGKQREAIALYDEVLRTNPDLFDAHLAYGISLDLLGEYSKAQSHLARAIELAPDEQKQAARTAMAVSLVFEGKAREAAAFYQQSFDANVAAGKHGDAAAIANALGRLYLETGDISNAKRWYETGYETARRQPDEPGSQLKLWELRWHHALARIAAREGKADEAKQHVEAAHKLMVDTPALKEQGPTLAYLDGYVALYLGDYDKALAALAQADQKDPFILMLQARAQEKLGRAAQAKETWTRVLEQNGHGLQNALARPAARKALENKS
jgi:tetratricopeptide (TPR) repeat protein